MKKKLALVTILTFLFIMMAGFVPALAEDGVGEWVQLADCASSSYPYGMEYINGNLYIIFRDSNDFYAYDIKTGYWEEKNNGGEEYFAGSSTTVLDGKLYVFGGISNRVRYYDPQTDSWTDKTPTGGPMMTNGTATTIKGKIYMTVEKAFYRYDPVEVTWTQLASCLQDSTFASSVNIGDKMYLAGGGNFLSVYDPETNQWTQLANGPSNFRVSAAGVIDGKMYVQGNYANLAMYDPASNQWTQLAKIPSYSNTTPAGTAAEGKYYHITAIRPYSILYVYTPEDYTDPSEPATPTNLQILMAKNETVNLTTFLVGTPDPEAMQWASSDTAVATVNENGNVTAVEVGTTVISVQNEDGSFKAAVRVRVMEGGLAPSGDPRLMVMLSTGEKFRLELTGGDDPVTWTSSDEAIVTVATWNSENRIGEVTAVAPGLTYITATDGIQTEQIYVQVR